MNVVEEFTYLNKIDDETLAFKINDKICYFRISDYDIPDSDLLFINFHKYDDNIDNTYFTVDDVPRDNSLVISWRLISRLISIVLTI